MIPIAFASIAATCVIAALAFYGSAGMVTLAVWLLSGVGLGTMVFAVRRRDTD